LRKQPDFRHVTRKEKKKTIMLGWGKYKKIERGRNI